MMDTNLSSSASMSAGESSVELIVKLSIAGEAKPHEVLCPRNIKVIETVTGAGGVHDSDVQLAPAPRIQRFASAKHSNAAQCFWSSSRSEERRVGKECRSRWS